jgi:hypothetical protein
LEDEGGGGVFAAVGEVKEEVHGPSEKPNGGGALGGTLEGFVDGVELSIEGEVVRRVKDERFGALELLR